MIASASYFDYSREGGVLAWLNAIRRHKWMTLLGVGLGGATALGVIAKMPERYVAEAVVALDVRKVQIAPLDAVVSRLPQESPVVRTELDVIGSRWMAGKVAERLGLAKPETGDGSNPSAASKAVIDGLLSRLKVSNDGRSYTIFISFTANDPATAARVANGFAEAYLDQQMSAQVGAARHASAWLGTKLEDLRNKLETSEIAVQSLQRAAGLFEANHMTVRSQRLNALSAELAIARTQRIDAEAKLKAAKDAARTDDKLAIVIGGTSIESLRAEKSRVTRSIAELESADPSKAQDLPTLKTQLASVQRQIDEEVERGLAKLENDVRVARNREKELEKTLAAMESELVEANEATVRLKQLEREASANSTIYESFLSRYKQTLEQESLAAPEARLISEAQPPVRPTNSWFPILVLGLVGGAGFGGLMAVGREAMDDRVRSLSLLQDKTGIPVFGALPRARGGGSEQSRWGTTQDRHKGYREAVRTLEATLRLAPTTRDAKILVIMSADADKGKTIVALSLARTMARNGRKVLLIGADRSTSARQIIGETPGNQFVDVIDGTQILESAIQTDPLSTAQILSPAIPSDAGASPAGSEAFKKFVGSLREEYDAIIIDAPPITASADGALIAGLSDAILLSVGWRNTAYGALAGALHQLDLCGLQVSGLVLSQVDEDLSSRTAVAVPGRRHDDHVAPGARQASSQASPRTGSQDLQGGAVLNLREHSDSRPERRAQTGKP